MRYGVLFAFISAIVLSHANAAPGKHLFIMSGQSNMLHLIDPNHNYFDPFIKAEFGAENVIFVKDARNASEIRYWYRDWVAPPGVSGVGANPLLYDRLMAKVLPAIQGQVIETVSFIWMQGESDAQFEYGSVYKASLIGLHQQLSNDLGRTDVNFVIGRLSDYNNPTFGDWDLIRNIQVEVGESHPRFGWINSDDLNGANNDLHYPYNPPTTGLTVLGQRFATKAIELIHANAVPEPSTAALLALGGLALMRRHPSRRRRPAPCDRCDRAR